MKILHPVLTAFLLVPFHLGVAAESNYRHHHRHEGTKTRSLQFSINPLMIGPLFMFYVREINSWIFDNFLFSFVPSCNRPCIGNCACDGFRCEVSPGSWFGTCQLQPTSFRDVTDDVLPPYTQTAPPLLDGKKTPIAAGVCTLDFDRDGLPDLYFASGQGFPNALMRNTGAGEFENVSEEWKLSYSNNSAISCLAVDLDNDGCEDLVLTGAYTGSNFTGNLLLRNTYCDDGTAGFSDETPDILRQWPYTVSSSAADIDNDGFLDIFVSSLPALDMSNFPGPVPLENFPGNSLLLHNKGGFQFEDITEGSGAGHPMCPCMVLFLDYDSDGFLDIIVINCGNDTMRTFSVQLYRNNRDLTFEDATVDAGFGPDSSRGMWMGGGVGDFNADGCLDFASTNLAFDVLWPDSDPKIFMGHCGENPAFTAEPVSIEPRNFAVDMTLFAWGPVARDFDNNGILDMFWSGNYHVATAQFEHLLSLVPKPDVYAEAEVLFGNGPDAEYRFRAESLPTDLREDYHFITTSGDYNGDGALDIVVAIDNGAPGPREGRPAVFYGIPADNNWIGIRLVGTSDTVNRQAIGAVVQLYKKENRTDGSARRAEQTLTLLAGSAAMTTEEKTLFFGVGSETVDQFEAKVLWPGGGPEWFDVFVENGVVTLTEGTGITVSMFLP